ncbi:MAG: diaminopimelate epimerase [Brevinema sp.]
MKIPFIKMTGLGNDYIFFNALDQGLSLKILDLIPKLSDRHFGIGGDGVIFIESSQRADCRMRIFNSDGREAPMCGNGVRELAKIVWDQGLIKKNPLFVETKSGIIEIIMTINISDVMESASVRMGYLNFDPKEIPFCSPNGRRIKDIYVFEYFFQGRQFLFYVGSVGTKHATCFLEEDVDSFDFCCLGKMIEQDKVLFPDGVNVEFVNILSPTKAVMRVWERGAGHTLACGTGAVFVTGLGMYLGFFSTQEQIEIQLEYGSLFIYQDFSGMMVMNGTADLVFEGEINIPY